MYWLRVMTVWAGQDQDLSIHLRPCLDKQIEKGDHWELFIRLHGTGNIQEVLEQRQFESVDSCMAQIVVRLETFMAVGDALSEVE